VFYIPPECDGFEELKTLIEEHGGIVVDTYGCYTYQIKITDAKVKNKDYY
jgi:hypothetical protein